MFGLTLTIITPKVNGLNYGESLGNITTLKKVTLGDGTQKTYISDKAIKYEIRHQGKERFNWRLLDKLLTDLIKNNLKEEKKGKKKETVLDVDEFAKQLIEKYEEFDLFGGLFTNLKAGDKEVKLSGDYDSVKRSSPVKVTYGFSIEPFKGDMDFMNNIDAYNRYIKYIEKGAKEQAIVNTETHVAHYYYTVTVDLDRIGVWETLEGEKENVLTPEEKKKRVLELLEVIKNLSRQIKGRWESLAPIFVIGGVFSVKNPFFLDSIKAKEIDGKLYLEPEPIKNAIELIPPNERKNVVCGMMGGYFLNEEEIKETFQPVSVAEAFEQLKKQVEKVFTQQGNTNGEKPNESS